MAANKPTLILDGDLRYADRPAVTASSRGLMYGDGIFETLRSYRGRLFKWDAHLSRLKNGLQVLGIMPPAELRKEIILPLIKDLMQANGLAKKDAILRLQVWREGGRGYLPQRKAGTRFMITASECPQQFPPPKLVTVDTRRIPSEALPSKYKFTNGINYILAAKEASEKQADDALMQTTSGYLSETTKANIFWRKGKVVFTPSEACDLLPGITREICMDLVQRDSGISLERGKFTVAEILDADTVWITNSVRELLPVRQINETVFTTDDELMHRLRSDFIAYRNRHLQTAD